MALASNYFIRPGVELPAFPPFLNISRPASVAKGWDDETMPFVP